MFWFEKLEGECKVLQQNIENLLEEQDRNRMQMQNHEVSIGVERDENEVPTHHFI